jgi:hypothetical protein
MYQKGMSFIKKNGVRFANKENVVTLETRMIMFSVKTSVIAGKL